jgi:hypothetical protein
MLHLNPNPQKPPKGGKFRYRTETGVEFEADDFDSLWTRVSVHESHALATTAEIQQRILAQVAVESPWCVVGTPTRPLSGPQSELRQWLMSLQDGGITYADNSVYSERKNICMKCECNMEVALDSEAKRRLFLLSRGYVDTRLGMCGHHRHHNALACWLDLPAKQGPSNCWLTPH